MMRIIRGSYNSDAPVNSTLYYFDVHFIDFSRITFSPFKFPVFILNI